MELFNRWVGKKPSFFPQKKFHLEIIVDQSGMKIYDIYMFDIFYIFYIGDIRYDIGDDQYIGFGPIYR